MAVYYKFKSAKDYDSIPIDGHFISVANLKEKIFESKHLGRGTDFDLMVANAQTNEEYNDEATLIPKNTSVLVRRIPGRPRMPIVTEREEPKVVDNKEEDIQSGKSGVPLADTSVMRFPEETEWDEFGNDLYAIPEAVQVQSSSIVQDAPLTNKADEDSKIKALIDTPALDWQRQPQDAFGAGRGFGRGMGGRMMGARGFGRGVFERKTPPAGYICHRCKIPGHFIQHCPTNGDPNYDIKKVKPPTGIPKSMLMATPDGSYALPSGAVAVLRPNEAAFEKEIEGLPSTRSVSDIPPELRCPLCKEVMKDAVLTSKCCFKSFCDRCIRDHIISKSVCVCGATNVLADDLLPNKTLRDTINRLLESNNSSAENAGSMLQIQDMESARPAQSKVPSPTLSATSKGEPMPPPPKEDNLETKETTNEANDASNAPQQPMEKGKMTKAAAISEATHESVTVKETTSQGSAALVEEEVQQKPSVSEPGKKKKKKKVRLPLNAAELQWRTPQDVAAENYGMMPFGPSACNPYWGGMQLGMDGFMNPYAGAMPYMGYVPGPFDVPFGGIMPQDPFGGYMMPPVVPPQRDLSEFARGSNPAPPVMSREEFEARKADLRRKREIERGVQRDFPKDREPAREMISSGDVSSMKSKHKLAPPPPESSDIHRHRHNHHHRSDRSPTPDRPSQSHHHHHHREERPSSSPARSHHQHHHRSLDRPPAPRPSTNKRRADPEDLPKQPSRNKRRTEPEDQPITINKAAVVTASASDAAAAAAADAERKKHKASVFSRISFPADGGSGKKRKASSHSETNNGGHKDIKDSEDPPFRSSSSNGPVSASASAVVSKKSVVMDNDSSDDERHFKRRPSRYEPTPPTMVEWDEQVRHSTRGGGGGLKERERGHKHR